MHNAVVAGRRKPGPGLRLAQAGLAAAVVWSAVACPPAGATDLEAARQQFLKSCGVCHAVDATEPDRVGPNLHGIFGRTAGSRPGFAYSETLKGGGWVWDAAALDRWIEDAQEAHPGTFMSYTQADPDKRALIIEFLRSEAAAATAAGKP